MLRSSVPIRAVDGRPLAASYYRARVDDDTTSIDDDSAPSQQAPVVIIAPAMAVRKSLYHHFAVHLAQRGTHVFTFDYRGTGASKSNGHDDGSLSRWAQLDLEGMLLHVERHHPHAKVCVVAHSVSGHLLPLAPSAARTVDAALIVATPAASWRRWPGYMQLVVWALCTWILPLVILFKGFLPGRFLGGPEDLTGEVIREWAAWGREHLSPGERLASDLLFPLGVLSFDDDKYGPHASVAAFGASYSRSQVEHRHVSTAEVGAALGHFGWANAAQGRMLWDGLATWIERTLREQPVALLAPALVVDVNPLKLDVKSDTKSGSKLGHPKTETDVVTLRPPSTEGA